MKNRIISAALAVLLLISASAFAAASASASLSYSFTNTDRGFAQGTITLAAPAGSYTLYWADDSSALDGYGELAKLTVGSSGKASHTMHAQTAIPADATKLIAHSGSSKKVSDAAAVYNIPANKLLGHKSSDRRYRFASYSDVHIDGVYQTYKYADTHWRKALDTAEARGAEFIVLSGDYTNNNQDYEGISAREWRTYQKVLAESDYTGPVYEAIGNHELWQGVSSGTKDFIKATGLEGDNGSASKAYFEKTLGGDHFIFMAMEGGFYPDRVEEFSTEQLDWLEGLLKKYTGDGKNIYIVEHSLFYKYGAGDTVTGEPYYDIPLSDNQASTRRFKALLEKYKDTIFISGHTHIAFSEQYNYSDNGGTSAQMIHNSSVGGTRHIINGKLDYTYYEDQTEGYIVDVFSNAIVFHGANLYYNTYDPNCCYILKTASSEETPTEATTASATAAPTTKPTTAAPATTDPSTGAATSYYLKGSFNSWGSSNPLYKTADADIITTTLKLSAGTYTFKLNSGSTWYGNEGIIEDTTKKTSNGGWIMTTSAGNCTLKATGGYYTFNFTLSSKKLNLLYSATDPYAIEPTEAVTTAPSTTKPATTEPTTAEQTTTPATEPTTALPEYELGDVDEDGEITISDATAVQQYLVGLRTLSSSTLKNAEVDGDGDISVSDATMIMRYLVGLTEKFPAAQSSLSVKKSLYSTGADIMTEVKGNLALYYRYSSYDSYQALKKQYRACLSGADTTPLASLQSALLKVVDPTNVDGDDKVTVYFENTNSWASVYAYCWGNNGAGNEKKWPGNEMSYVGKNEYGKSIYKYTMNLSKYPNVIFNDGSGNQTVDIAVVADSVCYYLSGTSSPYKVTSYAFKEKYIVG